MVDITGLQLIGVDDRDSTDPVKFQDIISGLRIDPSKPSILLKHQPSQLDIASKAGITLQISGHTHRAQIFPLNFFGEALFKGYDYGLHLKDNMIVYTSSGVGTWGPPMRVGSDSEVVAFIFN
jgi:predicted MPP superfamily phosphohydrolase